MLLGTNRGKELALLSTALVDVAATHNLVVVARDDAIAVHVVVFHLYIPEVYTVRAARVCGAHADLPTVGQIVHQVDGCGTKVVVDHRGVLRVANVDTTTKFTLTVAVNLVVLEQGLGRAVLVADTSAVIVDHHAVMYPEAIIPERIVLAANIAPQAIALLIVHVQMTCFKLGYPLDGRTVEAERRSSIAVGEELGMEDTALHVADAQRRCHEFGQTAPESPNPQTPQ